MNFPNAGKAIATCGIWLGVGLAAIFSPESIQYLGSGAAIATVLLWMFG